jgi:hypothetical protein
MWRRVRNREIGELLPQRNGIQPTSGQAFELMQTSETRRNVIRHLSEEQTSPYSFGNFHAGIGDIPTFRLPGAPGIPDSDVSWTYLPILRQTD